MNFIKKRLEDLNKFGTDATTQREPITVKLPPNVVQDLESVAKELNISRHALMVEILTEASQGAKELILSYEIMN